MSEFHTNNRMQSRIRGSFYEIDTARSGVDVGECRWRIAQLEQAVDQFLRRYSSVAQAKPRVTIEQQDE